MSGRPKTNLAPCSGAWACSVTENGQHCVCVMDAPAGVTRPCCQCDPPIEYEVQGRYAHGWEMVTTETTLDEAQVRLAEYHANDPQHPHRIVEVRA